MVSKNGGEATSGNVRKGRVLQDWITGFLEYTEGTQSPEIFRLWAAIGAVAGALERRVWVETARSVLFPNLYTLLVAPPGVGKDEAIRHVAPLWRGAKDLRVAHDSLTTASLIDDLAEAKRALVLTPTTLLEYNSLLIAAPEFGILVPSHDLEFLNKLNRIYDCPPLYSERRRHMKQQVIEIHKPQLNILAGTQPAYLASLLPEEAWGMGFMSRVLMIYTNQRVQVPLFRHRVVDQAKGEALLADLTAITRLYGRMEFSVAAEQELERWVATGMDPVPEHSKLVHYSNRRVVHVLKLAMVAAASQGNAASISLENLNTARDWLFGAELTMPDVFRDMVNKSDNQVLQDLHFFAWKIFTKERKAIHESRLIDYLRAKVPSEKIEGILNIADKSRMIQRQASTLLWVPLPKDQHGVE
jgi:hypothetical protein